MRLLIQDVKFALRYFSSNRPNTLALILTLALGIGPSCVIFTVLDSIYFKPLPYKNQHRLVLMSESNLVSGELEGTNPYTFLQWQAHSRTLEEMAAYRNDIFHLNQDNRPEAFPGQYVSEQFFSVLDMTPALGRGFMPEDFGRTLPRPAIVSHSLWMDYFSGRGDIIGLPIRLNGNPATVIGVMRPEFRSFMEGRTAKLWVPHVPVLTGPPESLSSTGALARLRTGVALEQARSELTVIVGELRHQFPEFYRQRGVSLRDFSGSQFAGLGPGLIMLCTMVGLVLLIACGNAANLLLVRAVARWREMGIRIALGAGRTRLMRQLLTENLLLSLAGGSIGLFLAFWGVDFIWSQTASIFQAIGSEAFQIDRRVVLFTLGLSVLTTLLFGVLPAWRCSHIHPNSVIKEEGVGPVGRGRGSRLSRALVVFQVALCMASLLGTALMVKSFLYFAEISGNPGFRTENLLVASIQLTSRDSIDSGKWFDLCQELRSRVAGLAGVQVTALADRLPFLERGISVRFIKEGSEAERKSQQEYEIQAHAQRVSPGYFDALAIPVIKGRPILVQDDQLALPVVLINETLAHAYWKQSDPVGQRIQLDGRWRTIVGIISNPFRESPLSPSPRQVYLPYLQSPAAEMKIIVYSRLDPLQLVPALRQQLRLLNPDQPLMEIRTMASALSRFLVPFRLILSLMSLFGLIALLLAGVGLYGVISQMVANSTRDIGIHSALGATRTKILTMVLIPGIRLAGIGLLLGIVVGTALIKVLPSQILGVTSLSPFFFLGILSFLWLLSALACLIPARRAASVEPMMALRHQ